MPRVGSANRDEEAPRSASRERHSVRATATRDARAQLGSATDGGWQRCPERHGDC